MVRATSGPRGLSRDRWRAQRWACGYLARGAGRFLVRRFRIQAGGLDHGAIEDQSFSKSVDNDLDEREEMAADINTYIVDPLVLLAGLFAHVEGEENDYTSKVKNIGNLLGLFVRGARAELEIHKKGGYKVKAHGFISRMGVDLDDIGTEKDSAANEAEQEACHG